jgi:import inner membrane translocase subunit TIM22
MQKIMESCPAKTVMSGVMGFALGGAFGLFMASVCAMPTSVSFSLFEQ